MGKKIKNIFIWSTIFAVGFGLGVLREDKNMINAMQKVEAEKEIEYVEIVKEIPVEVVKEVEIVKEIIKEVPVEVIKEVEVVKEVSD